MSKIEEIERPIYVVSHEELIEIIKRSYYTKTSLFIQGAIGIGKSYSVREAAKQIAQELSLEFKETKAPILYPDKFCLVDQRFSQKDAGEVLGIPEDYAIVKYNGHIELVPIKHFDIFTSKWKDKYEIIDYTTKWTAPVWFPREGHGIIFADELPLAPPLVRNAIWELINDRALGDYELPDGWIVIGAGNRGHIDGCPEFKFEAPLCDRFSWYELSIPSIESWSKWAAEHNIDPRIISFLRVRPSNLYTYNPKHKEKAFATPRSWEYTSKLINGIDDLDQIFMYASGRVGTYVAQEFVSFLKLRDKLKDPEEYIENPETIEIPSENDLLYALCTSLIEYLFYHVKNNPEDKSREILRRIFLIANRIPREYCTFMIKSIKVIMPDFFYRNALKLKEWSLFVPTIGKYLEIRKDA